MKQTENLLVFLNLFPCGLLLLPYSCGINFHFGFNGNVKLKKNQEEGHDKIACVLIQISQVKSTA